MNRNGTILAVACMILIVTAGCVSTPGVNRTSGNATLTPSPPLGVSEDHVVAANNRFAFDMYSALRTDPRYEERNIFFSPVSLSSALALVYEGA
ncbi:MAG: serpin family protein, partial [Methanoregulaceae archaeon]|nr:serpin family protein [Methanoregulaceae archaeon]